MPKSKPCPNCQNEMWYLEAYHCYECDNCNKTYNYGLQELAPRIQWQREYDEDDY